MLRRGRGGETNGEVDGDGLGGVRVDSARRRSDVTFGEWLREGGGSGL
jgi:hypothetical protein